jgi:hypothetical protein
MRSSAGKRRRYIAPHSTIAKLTTAAAMSR